MFRPFRPSLEKLENREVFSAGPLSLAAAVLPQGVIHPFSDFAIQMNVPRPSGKNVDGADFLAWQRHAQAADQTTPPAIWLEGTYRDYQQEAAPESQPTAITGTYNASTGVLTAVPGSQPTLARDFDNDGDVDGADFLAARSVNPFAPDSRLQALLGSGDGAFQSQVAPEAEDANDVNSVSAESHDAFFHALGMQTTHPFGPSAFTLSDFNRLSVGNPTSNLNCPLW
jgi:hypothetical protein